MNERIRELAIQSGLNSPYGSDHEGLRDFDYRKFAELIVRECVRYFNEDYERDFDSLWREDLSKGIKKHFGIKE
jgi:hypothetical protein